MSQFQIDMRRRLTRFRIFTGCILLTAISVIGQDSADSIILSAMKHELNRNMHNLVKDGYDKPFFISYTIADIKTAFANGTLGALTSSGENHYKDWNARVMVGDYELNDENFVSNDVQSSVNRITHQMPVDNDYLGIRLALWSVTDNIYNSAATQYKRKKMLIEDEKVQKELLGISDFSKAEVVKRIKPYQQVELDKSMLENKVRKLSKVFANHPEIYNSNVSARQFATNIYFINSEGTEVIYPAQFSVLTISVNTLTERNESLSRNLVYNSLTVDGFPDEDLILSDINYIIEDINLCASMEPFNDDYSGPIIYTGDVAANVFLTKLFSSYGNNLKSSRKPLQRNDQMGTYYDESNNTKQWKIGKKVLKNNITVTEYSKLKSFNGIPLWGSFEVDGEGVTPPDSIVLIENGFVKNKLNGRTPSKEVDSTNGHMRLEYGYGGIDKAIGPGVVKVTSSTTSSYEELKKRMLAMAKEEGLEYGIVVKEMPVHATVAPIKIFKVMVETGEEVPLHAARLGTLDDKVFKDIAGVSGSLIVYNSLYSGGVSDVTGSGGMPVSVITPSALLFEEIEIEPVRIRYSNMKPILDSPLQKK